MTGMIANLLLNVLIIVLLCLTIGYCWLLNRRIRILQDSRSELALLLKHFDDSTQRASDSIIALQTASKKIGENIQFRIDKANYLLDDLTFMIEKGNKIANQLEASFAVNRARSKNTVEEQHYTEHAPEPKMSALPPPKQIEKGPTVKEKTVASLEAVLGRVAVRPELRESTEKSPQALRSRSRAEQELLDMIKSGVKG